MNAWGALRKVAWRRCSDVLMIALVVIVVWRWCCLWCGGGDACGVAVVMLVVWRW